MGKRPVNNKCKFCSSYSHISFNCLSTKYKIDKYLGKNIHSATYKETLGYAILPMLSFIVSRGRRKAKITFVLDSGANVSCISKEAVEKHIGKFRHPSMNMNVTDVNQSMKERKGYIYPAKITLPSPHERKIKVDFYIFEKLALAKDHVALGNVIHNICQASIPLHPYSPYQGTPGGFFSTAIEISGVDPDSPYQGRPGGFFSTAIEILGVLGVDVLQYIKPYLHEELIVCGDKKANFIKIGNGYIPFGNSEFFLSSVQIDQFYCAVNSFTENEDFKKMFKSKMRKRIFERNAAKGKKKYR